MNGFIIFYSCLDSPTTKHWTSFVTNIFSSAVNKMTEKETQVIPLTAINTSFSDEKSHIYNNIPGYKLNEIPLGSAKQIESTFLPNDATDTSITYSSEQSDLVRLNQSGSTVSIVGMKEGTAIINATNKASNIKSSVEAKIVDRVEPFSFVASLPSYDLPIGKTLTVEFDIDGGVLGHNELINSRYYDIRKLTYKSENESILKINNYGVITPISVGKSKVTVSNKSGNAYSFEIDVLPGTTPTMYSNLNISGPSICYSNDMINDQNGGKNHYQLAIKDGDSVLDPLDFIWESYNELLVRVDRYGVVRGFRKTTNDDEKTTIKAISKLTGQEAFFEVTVKNQLPSNMFYYVTIGEKEEWNLESCIVSVGDNIKVRVGYEPKTDIRDVMVDVENESLIDCTNEGTSLVLHIKKEGKCKIKITSVVNPKLSKEIEFSIVTSGAIPTENMQNVELSLRKSVGHAAMFLTAQVFTYLSFCMFLYDKKWWLYSFLSLGSGLTIAGISELIQFFVPGRGGSFLDILIDFSGIAIGAALTFVCILLIKRIKAKKKNNH